MKYSDEMIKAHEARVKQYETVIGLWQQRKFSKAFTKAWRMYHACLYCKAAPKNNRDVQECAKCVVGKPTSIPGDMPCLSEEFGLNRWPLKQAIINKNRAEFLDLWSERLDQLVLQAEFNMSERGCE